MVVVGLDLSMNSSGLAKWDTDDMQGTFTFKGFTDTVKWESEHIISHKNTNWNTRFEKTEWFLKEILEFVKGADYIALEDHSLGSTGLVFDIAAFVGVIKQELFRLGYKFMTIPPTTHKKFTTGKGTADKCQTTDALLKRFAWLNDNKELISLNKYKSPQADIFDAISLCYTLDRKLKFERDESYRKTLEKFELDVMKATSKKNPTEFWRRSFFNG